MDYIIQVCLEEFHIDKIKVSLGIRLINYYADASLLEGEGTYSFQMFDNCTQSIFEARGDRASQRGHTPGDGPTELLSMLRPRMDGPHQLLS